MLALTVLSSCRQTAKGIIDAREAGLGAAMDELWKDENLGKAWTLVPACRSARLTSRLMRNSWCFRRSTPVETANAAVDPSGTASRREQLAVYLEAFARYFRAEHIVPMLIANACANESLRSSLNTLYNSLPETDRALAPSWHCHTCAFPENRRESLKCEQCGGDPPPPPEPDSDDEDGGGVPEDVSFWLYDSEGTWRARLLAGLELTRGPHDRRLVAPHEPRQAVPEVPGRPALALPPNITSGTTAVEGSQRVI